MSCDRTPGAWADAGFDPEQAGCWIADGIREPDDAAAYDALGLDPAGAREWADAWVGPADAAAWTALGLDVRAADGWVEHGIGRQDAAPWMRRSASPALASALIDAAGGPGEALRDFDAG